MVNAEDKKESYRIAITKVTTLTQSFLREEPEGVTSCRTVFSTPEVMFIPKFIRFNSMDL